MEIRPILSALARNRTAPLLLALQVAIGLAILANALHIVDVRLAQSQRPSGVRDESTLFRIDAVPMQKHAFNDSLARQKMARLALQAIPGILSVAGINQMPMTRNGSMSGVAVDRRQSQPTATVATYASADSLIRTLGLVLIEGRDFTPDDVLEVNGAESDASPKTVIVTRDLARLMYPGAGTVIGKPLLFGIGEDADALEIVGVVERLQTIGAEAGARGEYSVILPLDSVGRGAQFAVRTEAGQRERVIGAAEAALRNMANEPVAIVSTGADQDRDQRYRKERALAWMLLAVSGLLLLVTASGVLGMSTLWVAQRRRQIGVRRALGARKWDILRYFITENILITSAGIAAGLLLALALNQLLVSKLEMAKLPLPVLLAGASLFWPLGVLAALGPALRAASIAPAIASRAT